MRNSFIATLVQKAKKNDTICLMVGDLGYGAIEPFFQEYPDRAINAGIAEQNMVGMAAGLAMTGKHVFTYSIGNFPTFRCAEQLRNDVDYHDLPVTTVAVGGGLSYGSLGYSHHTVQDYGLMRLFPNTIIMAPCDPNEVVGCMNFICQNPSPSYLRIGKTNERNFTTERLLTPGCVNTIKTEGAKNLILTTGTAIQNTPQEFLNDRDVFSVPIWGQQVDISLIEKLISKYNHVQVLEDHLKSGGFFSWINECITDRKLCTKLTSVSLTSDIIGQVGSHTYLQNNFLKFE